jgi:oligopeptide/dipeptide ABC transporter ATP-binding protein
MDRDPYLALRNFKVWFSRHRGFLEALRRTNPDYVRAVDGIDITIGKGEIYCLVGESGCGKTTTGKGILRLVEPTAGDVFLSPTEEELAKFDSSKPGENELFIEELRRRRSLTYQEKARRSLQDWIRHILLGLGGAVLGVLVGFALIMGFRAVGAGSGEFIAYLCIGVPIAFGGTLPWVKMGRRVPYMLAISAIPASVVVQVLSAGAMLAANGERSDLGAALVSYTNYMAQNTVFVALTEMGLAALTAWFMTGLFANFWARRRGIETDRLHKLRTRLQIIFQDPYESLNPRHTVYRIVAEPLLVNGITRGIAETAARVERALSDAGLRPPREYLLRYPHELSGGQRQRVGIAGALVLEPEFLVADEPVSMLDVSIRTQIVELLLELRKKRGLTYLFITHDLSLAYVLADRIGVMYLGKIVEEGPTEELIANPRHPYTKALISVVPVADPDIKHERIVLKGERPDPSNIPPGCRFHPRCPVAFERCGWTSDELLDTLRELATGNDARYLQGATARGSATIVWRRPPEGLESWLRGLIAERSEMFRALKAIQSIAQEGDGVEVALHAFEQPALKTVVPGVLISCHLY